MSQPTSERSPEDVAHLKLLSELQSLEPFMEQVAAPLIKAMEERGYRHEVPAPRKASHKRHHLPSFLKDQALAPQYPANPGQSSLSGGQNPLIPVVNRQPTPIHAAIAGSSAFSSQDYLTMYASGLKAKRGYRPNLTTG